MATLIQVPRAVEPSMFAGLTLSNFITPVFRSLFQAVAAAGGLPSEDTPQGLWMHNLTKAGGPMLESVINELAVMPLPLPPSEDDMNVGRASREQEGAVQLRKPTDAERRYSSELRTIDEILVEDFINNRSMTMLLGVLPVCNGIRQ